MHRNKSWLFIVLLSLSLNIFHGFFVHHHVDIHESSHKHMVEADHDVCDKCHSFHVNFILDDSQPKIPLLAMSKPLFDYKDLITPSNIFILFKPPIS